MLGTVVSSRLQQDFMDELGWEVWPSGLALGPHGWLQTLNFVVLGALLFAFAVAVRAVAARNQWVRVAPWLVALAGVGALLLGFETDPPGESSWHGTIHAAGYFTWIVSLLVSYPLTWWRLRHDAVWARQRWPLLAPLLLFPPAFLLPDDDAAGNYVFFAVALTPLAAIAARMTVGSARSRRT
jgi:hypothetical protein